MDGFSSKDGINSWSQNGWLFIHSSSSFASNNKRCGPCNTCCQTEGETNSLTKYYLASAGGVTWMSSASAGMPPRRKIGWRWLSSKLHRVKTAMLSSMLITCFVNIIIVKGEGWNLDVKTFFTSRMSYVLQFGNPKMWSQSHTQCFRFLKIEWAKKESTLRVFFGSPFLNWRSSWGIKENSQYRQ